MHDLRISRHKIDIRFWRDGETTAFAVVKENSQVVERCDIAESLLAIAEA